MSAKASARAAGLKKVTMELGSNAPVIVLPDADLEKAAKAIAVTGYANAGQVCISAQRILTHNDIYGDLLHCLSSEVEGLTTGNPLDEGVRLGPMVRERDAERVQAWIQEAARAGGRLIRGGERQGAVVQPAIVADVDREMRISCEGVVRSGGGADALRVGGRRHCERQCDELRFVGGRFHRESDQRHALRPRGRVGATFISTGDRSGGRT